MLDDEILGRAQLLRVHINVCKTISQIHISRYSHLVSWHLDLLEPTLSDMKTIYMNLNMISFLNLPSVRVVGFYNNFELDLFGKSYFEIGFYIL